MLNALLIYNIFQSFLFAIALFSGRKVENKALAFYFLHFFLSNVFYGLTTGFFGDQFKGSEVIRLTYEFLALSRNAIIMYFLFSLLRKPIPRPIHLLWLLPVSNLVIDHFYKVYLPELYNAGFYTNWYLNFPMYTKILLLILLIHQLSIFKKELIQTKHETDHFHVIKMYWGKYFILFQILLSSFSLLYIMITLANGRLYAIDLSIFNYSANDYSTLNLSITAIFLLVFGYLAIRNPSFFNDTSQTPSFEQKMVEIVLPENEKSVIKKIDLSTDEMQGHIATIRDLCENQKVYLNPELSLSELSRLSSIPSRLLSQLIQMNFQKTYKEYINGFRVENAKKMLRDRKKQNHTMYTIAFESGFNSESSFYKTFKELTSLTPKQFQLNSKESDIH